MKLPDDIAPDAVRWLTAKLNGDSEKAREIMPVLLAKNVLEWHGGETFSIDSASRELVRLAPELLDDNEIAARCRAGDRDAMRTRDDAFLAMMQRRQAPADSRGRRTYEQIKAELEAEMRRHGVKA